MSSIVKGVVGGAVGFLTGGPVGAAVGAGAGLLSGAASNAQADATTQAAQTSANATKIASDANAAAQKYSTDIQKQMYDQTRADQTPWRNVGVNALSRLQSGTAPGGELISSYPDQKKFALSDFTADPGYDFRLNQGISALDRSAAARGGLFSGAQGKALARYGQDYGSNEYQNAYNRYQNEYQNNFNRYQTNQNNQYNRLASLAGLGQTANSALQSAGNQYAGAAGNYAMTGAQNTGNLTMTNAANMGNAQLMAGQARASGYQGFGNALGSIAGSNYGGGSGGNYFNDLNTYGGQANAWLQNAW